MRYRFRFFFIFLLSIISYSAFAQNISGRIIDTTQAPLMGAMVELKTDADSPVAATITDEEGAFLFEQIGKGNYVLHIDYIGMGDITRSLSLSDKDYNFGNIMMQAGANMLQEVQVVATVAPVVQRDDTTQYNASSFKTNPDATAEDLIRKMPGMDLSGGSPKAQGEAVTKVLIDGKPFFGDDPTTTLRNLPAEIVDKVQVYDEKSEESKFTGFDDGQTTKTINIVTKDAVKKGRFGKAYAAYGYDNKYNVGGSVNLFKNDRRLTLIGQSNNVNIQNFDAQDLVGVSNAGRRRWGNNGNSDFMVGQQDGIATTNAAGINYSNEFFDKLKLSTSYFFNNSNIDQIQDINRQYVLASNSGQSYQESSRSQTDNYNHRFNMRLEYTIDSFNSILFIPTVSYQSNNSRNTLHGQNNLDGDALNSTITDAFNKRQGWNANAFMLYRHKFQKDGRTFSLSLRPSYNDNGSNGTYTADNTYFSTPSLNDTLDQQYTNDRANSSVNARLNYTEPLGKKSQLQLQYRLYLSQSSANKETWNFDPFAQEYTDFDSLLSNKFGSHYSSHSPGLSYRLSDSLYNLGFGVNYQFATMESQRELPYSASVNRDFQSVLPYLFFRYRISKTKNLRIFFRADTEEPSVEQLQNVIDNSNPLQLSSGNPFLVQSYETRLTMRYNASVPAKGRSFFAMLRATNTSNYITNSTVIAQNDTLLSKEILLAKGGQYVTPVNMSGYWDLSGLVTYGQMIKPIKTNLNINAGLGFTRTPGMINLQHNFSSNTNFLLGLTLSSNINENIDFTLTSNSSVNFVNNTLNTASNNNYFNQNSRLSFNYIFWKGFVVNTELNHQLYNGMSQGYNQSFLLWNMSVGKKLFKNQQGEIRLSVFDLLNQNSNISRTVTESYYQDVQTNNLQRYFMLTFTYKFRKFTGDSEKEFLKGGGDRGDMAPPGGAH